MGRADDAGPGSYAEAAASAPVRFGDISWDGDSFLASVVLPGRPGHVRAARDFTGQVLGDHPCTELAILLVSELVTNSVKHSRSAGPEGTIGVTVTGTSDSIRVAVADAGGVTVPEARPAGPPDDEGGRGLQLVAELAGEWGYQRTAAGCVTWFRLKAGS